MLNNLSPIVHFCGLKRLCVESADAEDAVCGFRVIYRGNGPFTAKVELYYHKRHPTRTPQVPREATHGTPRSRWTREPRVRPTPCISDQRFAVGSACTLPAPLTPLSLSEREPSRLPHASSPPRALSDVALFMPLAPVPVHRVTQHNRTPGPSYGVSPAPSLFPVAAPSPHIPCRGSSPHRLRTRKTVLARPA